MNIYDFMNDYFSENSVYTETQFRCRFRMRQQLFIQVVNTLSSHNDYFQMRPNVVDRIGLSSLQKCTSVIRILAYGSSIDCIDEYVRIGECNATQCLQKFVRGCQWDIWTRVLEKIQQQWHQWPTTNWRCTRISRYVRFYWLHALRLRKLSSCMVGPIS